NIEVLLQPCPGLVEQVERAELTTVSTRLMVTNYVSPLLEKGADTIVLGCTHYPFLGQIIQEVAGADITIIDPAASVARELARQLNNHQISSISAASGTERFFTTGSVVHVQWVTSTLWGRQVTVDIVP
ncbi:MAG: glutamate racemase, partial [Desulfamplus sp.]